MGGDEQGMKREFFFPSVDATVEPHLEKRPGRGTKLGHPPVPVRLLQFLSVFPVFSVY